MKRVFVLLACLAAISTANAEKPQPPIDLGTKNADDPTAPSPGNAAVLLPDGSLESYFRRGVKDGVGFFGSRSTDNGRNWATPVAIPTPPKIIWGGPMPLLDRDGEVHFIIPTVRGNGRSPGADLFVDLFHMRSSEGRTKWSEPVRMFEGYVGSLQGVFQLKSGRIIVPYADWTPGVAVAPPTGPEVVTCSYSDDGGKTWQRSPAKLTAPCHDDNNGNNYGACEPSLIELNDGRVWMLIRTQDGFLYESFTPDGVDWSPAKPSRFHSSDSPAFPLRLADGRIVVFWNNCEVAPRVGKDGVYSGRDVLHAALSSDEGKTWSGFREVYRDSTRNGSPPKSGDRGTAYPHATLTQDGKILLVSGQGAERRRRFLIDPDWLTEKSQSENFANLDTWHLFKGFGKPERYWRDRVQGPQLIAHPDKPDAKVLRMCRPDERDPDGAVWNFPNAQRGEITLRLRIEKNSGGAQISLTDRMFEPCDDNGETKSAFTIKIGPDGRTAGAAVFQPGQWHKLQLAWSTQAGTCTVKLDDQAAGELQYRTHAPSGLNYLRLRSTAASADAAGFLVESVNMEVK